MAVELIGEEGRRVLQYLDMVERQGVQLTVAQLDRFADLVRPQWVPWGAGGDEDYLVDRTIDWSRYMELVEWIQLENVDPQMDPDDERRTHAKIRLTALGRAVLTGTATSESAIATQVLLGEEDPHAYGTVMASLASRGAGLLVDPYLTDAILLDLLKVTSVTRVLTSTKGAKGRDRVAALAALAQTNGLRTIAVKTSDTLHDRFFMSDGGDVVALGASLNGLEKNVTTLAPISGDAANALRQHFESVWGGATSVTFDGGAKAGGGSTQGSGSAEGGGALDGGEQAGGASLG